MTKSDTTQKLFTALHKAQGEMKAVGFDCSNKFLGNRYASLGAIIEASRSVLAKYGLAVVQMPINDGGQIGVETVLTHESGEWIANRFLMSIGEEKGKSAAQVAGSIITYLRRYSLGAFLNAYADEDNDAESSGSPAPINAPKPVQPPAKPVVATDKTRAHMIAKLKEAGFVENDLQEYGRKAGILTATEILQEWPLAKCPTTKDEFQKLRNCVTDFLNGGEAVANK